MKIDRIIFFILFLFSSLDADYTVMPQKSYEDVYIPPFVQNLVKKERETQQNEEQQKIKDIFENVIEDDKKEPDQDTSFFARNSTQFNTSLQQFPKEFDKGVFANNIVVTPKIRKLLHETYSDPFLHKKKISLTLKKTAVRDVISFIAQSSNLNIVVDPEIKSIVSSFRVCDVSVAVTLKMILAGQKPRLVLLKDGVIWRVSQLASVYTDLVTKAEFLHIEEMIPVVQQIYYTRWNETFKMRARAMWQGLIDAENNKQNYYLVIDDESRKLFFCGKKMHIDAFKSFLCEMDVKIPQICIQGRVVLTDKNIEKSLGFQWSGIYNRKSRVKKGFQFVGVGPLEDIQNDPVQVSDLMDWVFNLFPTVWEKARNFHIPVVFGGKDLNTLRLNLVLNAAENRNEIKTILKPMILANNNELAEMLEGEMIPIETIVEESVEGRLRNVRTATYKDVGIQLKVRPVVMPGNKSVSLEIYVENSMVAQESMSTTNGGSSTTGTIYPTIITSRSRTKVLLKSGQTTMIGGLIKNRKSKEKTALPLLSKIPIIGWLFKGYRKIKNDLQLLIFITPTIVDNWV